jgi:hypothetical protein
MRSPPALASRPTDVPPVLSAIISTNEETQKR